MRSGASHDRPHQDDYEAESHESLGDGSRKRLSLKGGRDSSVDALSQRERARDQDDRKEKMRGDGGGMQSGENGDPPKDRLSNDSQNLSQGKESNPEIGYESERIEERSESSDTEHEGEKSVTEFDPDVEWILELFWRGGVGAGCTLWPCRAAQS